MHEYFPIYCNNSLPQLKLKNMVTTQQEKLLGEKEMVIERQKHELQSINEDLGRKQDEVYTK